MVRVPSLSLVCVGFRRRKNTLERVKTRSLRFGPLHPVEIERLIVRCAIFACSRMSSTQRGPTIGTWDWEAKLPHHPLMFAFHALSWYNWMSSSRFSWNSPYSPYYRLLYPYICFIAQKKKKKWKVLMTRWGTTSRISIRNGRGRMGPHRRRGPGAPA